jgi:RNA polymerase sigma factor (sigma-70 family)
MSDFQSICVAAQSGDSDALGYLLKYAKNITYRLIHVDQYRMDDVLSEVNLALIKMLWLSDFDPQQDGLKAYFSRLVQSAIRRYLDRDKLVYISNYRLRKEQEKYPDKTLSELASVVQSLDTQNGTIEVPTRVCTGYEIREFFDYVDLTSEQRAIVWYLYEGYTYAEIAEKLETSPATISNRIKAIRKRCLKKYPERKRLEKTHNTCS